MGTSLILYSCVTYFVFVFIENKYTFSTCFTTHRYSCNHVKEKEGGWEWGSGPKAGASGRPKELRLEGKGDNPWPAGPTR